jgi:hypothetical protein
MVKEFDSGSIIIAPGDRLEIALFRELGEDLRPNTDGVIPTLAVEYRNDGCRPTFRIYQKFEEA